MTPTQASLGGLPAELLCQIIIHLPSSAALAFHLTCRHIYTACKNESTWQKVAAAQPTLAKAYRADLHCRSAPGRWKRYVVADALATNQHRALTTRDVENWLPHLVSLQHPMLLSFDMSSLSQLCDSVCSTPIVSGSDVDPESERETFYPLSPRRDKDSHTWQLVQAANFCLSAQLLANPGPLDGEQPPPLLKSTQWFRLTNHQGVSVGTRDDVHLVMLHALAYRAVGFFFRELCWAISNGSVYDDHADLGLPPTALSLPLATLCTPTVPFTPDGIARLSTCHLSSITAPSFFTDDEWTGFVGLYLQTNTMMFSRIGSGDLDQSLGLTEIDRTIRYRLLQEWDGGNKYLLQSTPFMQGVAWIMRVTVERDTGYLKIAYQYLAHSRWIVRDGVITPFGIVFSDSQGFWAWIWKSKWSGTKAQ